MPWTACGKKVLTRRVYNDGGRLLGKADPLIIKMVAVQFQSKAVLQVQHVPGQVEALHEEPDVDVDGFCFQVHLVLVGKAWRKGLRFG